MMPAVTVCESAKGLPMASTQSPTCAVSELPSLTVGSGRVGVDLDDRQIGGLVDADHARRTAQVLVVRVGGELDVDLVGLLDNVIVGDDVALGIDDEAGAERLACTAGHRRRLP